jgi:hypothetical protein
MCRNPECLSAIEKYLVFKRRRRLAIAFLDGVVLGSFFDLGLVAFAG